MSFRAITAAAIVVLLHILPLHLIMYACGYVGNLTIWDGCVISTLNNKIHKTSSVGHRVLSGTVRATLADLTNRFYSIHSCRAPGGIKCFVFHFAIAALQLIQYSALM